MKTYIECWTRSAAGLFPQALAGAPEWVGEESAGALSEPGFGFVASLGGACQGEFAVWADAGLLEAPLLGEGQEQKSAWEELLREIAESAAGEMTAGGASCRVASFSPWQPEAAGEPVPASRSFQIRTPERSWTIQVRDTVQVRDTAVFAEPPGAEASSPGAPRPSEPEAVSSSSLDLLLDLELEAALRFGSREMTLSEILDLGPGDVVQLDRHIAEPVDLIVADKIVARGEVVLVNGNFGLRVTEVAAPKKRLESIRCLF